MTQKIEFKVVKGYEILFSSESAEEAGKFYDEHKNDYSEELRLVQDSEF